MEILNLDLDFTVKNNNSILLNFDKEIELNHFDYQTSGDVKYFNNVVQWMMEDIETAAYEIKFIFIDNFYHYLMNNIEEIYDDRKFYIEKAKYYLRNVFKYKDSIGYPLYIQAFNDMELTIEMFLLKIEEYECKKIIMKKEMELIEAEKYLRSVGLITDERIIEPAS
jgi:hypothetical protein